MSGPADLHERAERLLARELERFERDHPRSRALAERAGASLLAGVPMHWMVRWPGRYPVFAVEAHGARFTDADGLEYVDFCLGDTGAMTGHAPEPVLRAVAEQAARGITLMLPSEAALAVGEELTRRFGLPRWQFALTATDANRFVIRLARHVTRRPKVLVFNWCYHGTVDETFATLADGRVVEREGAIGPPVPLEETTRMVEWNDVPALERELAHGDVACVLTEPALTNIGIVHPEPGFHDALRRATRETGTLLVIDETHTLCAGPGGFTRAHGLEPDVLTVGKAIGSGIPSAAYGFTAEVAARIEASIDRDESDVGGIGGTLAGNVLSLAAVRATLEHVLTDEAFARMIALGERFERGVQEAIDAHGLPWHVTRLGCRVEYLFRPERPVTGSAAAAGADPLLDRLIHLYALNRGILLTPFHNMALMSPATTEADVDRHTEVFAEAAREARRMTPPHATAEELEAGLAHVLAAPCDAGTVELLVRRPRENEREVLDEAELDPERGLAGDRWADGSAHPGRQLTLMSARVLELVAGGRDRWALAGDQLCVDLDLGVANLPPGTRLAVGGAELEVTDEAHTGCAKFTERFGPAAIRFVNGKEGRPLRLRGMYARVVRGGVVRRGDAIRRLL